MQLNFEKDRLFPRLTTEVLSARCCSSCAEEENCVDENTNRIVEYSEWNNCEIEKPGDFPTLTSQPYYFQSPV